MIPHYFALDDDEKLQFIKDQGAGHSSPHERTAQ